MRCSGRNPEVPSWTANDFVPIVFYELGGGALFVRLSNGRRQAFTITTHVPERR